MTGWPLVREKSGNFANWSGNFKYQESQIISAQNMCCSRYFDCLKCEKKHWYILSLVSLALSYENCAKKLCKDFICFICRIRKVHFSQLVKGICHLLAARRQIGRKTAVFWSVKNLIWSEKSQWKVEEFCVCMRVATLNEFISPTPD